MTDPIKLQALFEAALRDTTDFIGRMPKPAVPTCNPSVRRPAIAVPVSAEIKPVMATTAVARARVRFW